MGVDTWNDAPTMTDGAGWKPDDSAPAGDGWTPDNTAETNGFTGEFGAENISKHADGPHDGGCRNCGDDNHFARDCPEVKKSFGACFNCGEEGHSKVDCLNERVEREFTGECRNCGEVGHRAAACPTKPAAKCKACGEEDHATSDCGKNRITIGVKELSLEDAWKAVEDADKEKDVDDIKKAILTYAKAFPAVTFEELEGVFREAGMNTFLIAREQAVSDTHTIVNLQGKIDQKYTVGIQFSAKPRRAKFAEGYPSSPEENLVRLTEAGFPLDRMVPKCANCNQMGHGSRQCPEEKQEKEKIVITCANCNEEGHRARDCQAPRKTGGRACKNCGEEGHMAKDCEKPRSAENVECKNCGEMGHFSKDCPSRAPDLCRNCGQEGHRKADCQNERVMQCRNCDEWGHSGRECPLPRDWSRVECSNCHEKGHTQVRCKAPKAEKEEDTAEGGGVDWGDNTAAASSGNGDWGANETTAGGSGDGS